jgi:hypothetical protein
MRIARTPVDSQVCGEASCYKGDQDEAQPFSLFREVSLVVGAGFVPSEVAEGRGDSGDVASFERGIVGSPSHQTGPGAHAAIQ